MPCNNTRRVRRRFLFLENQAIQNACEYRSQIEHYFTPTKEQYLLIKRQMILDSIKELIRDPDWCDLVECLEMAGYRTKIKTKEEDDARLRAVVARKRGEA